MSKTDEFLRYFVAYNCLHAWKAGELLTIQEIKGMLTYPVLTIEEEMGIVKPTSEDLKARPTEYGISTDTINRFLPQWKYKEIEKNIPGLKTKLRSSLSGTLLIPSDIDQLKEIVDAYEAKVDLKLAQRRVNDPAFREDEREYKQGKGSPYFQKKWKELLEWYKILEESKATS